jgi:hypothetical protein
MPDMSMPLVVGPMSVLAVKNRYLPPLSNARWRTSLMPSVTCCFLSPPISAR